MNVHDEDHHQGQLLDDHTRAHARTRTIQGRRWWWGGTRSMDEEVRRREREPMDRRRARHHRPERRCAVCVPSPAGTTNRSPRSEQPDQLMATRGGQVKGDKGMGGGARGKEKRKAIHTHTHTHTIWLEGEGQPAAHIKNKSFQPSHTSRVVAGRMNRSPLLRRSERI
jgi:hypothetical protein